MCHAVTGSAGILFGASMTGSNKNEFDSMTTARTRVSNLFSLDSIKTEQICKVWKIDDENGKSENRKKRMDLLP